MRVTSIYQVEFVDGVTKAFTVNYIAKTICNQVDDECNYGHYVFSGVTTQQVDEIIADPKEKTSHAPFLVVEYAIANKLLSVKC